MEKSIYKLSPSDFAYLYEDCKHCYYQKVKLGVGYSGQFPSMFTRINSLLQNSIMGMNLQDIHPELPVGVISVQEGFLKSQPIPGVEDCYIGGRFDILSKLEDGTYALIDFKIITPDEDKIKKYASQLQAYKYALENPANGNEPLKITKMGVVSILPEEMKLVNGKVVFVNTPGWHPVTDDSEGFYGLIKEISTLLNGELPSESETCKLCLYRKNFHPKTETVDDISF
ncbi:MAG TPA: PD-(D/E)XK nuclease family protein [Candidatus Saccharimonadales bacterium]|nr:PD-(D/E)XK nuclease family protein [Candidatus Saccharimonadales bacterium]